MISKEAEKTIHVYDFRHGKTRYYHLEIMVAVQNARLQAFITASKTGYTLRLYNLKNLRLSWNVHNVSSVIQTEPKRDVSKKASSSRQELISIEEFSQYIWENPSAYKSLDANALMYLSAINQKFTASNLLERNLRLTTDSLTHRTCVAGFPCKHRKPSSTMKGIYGQGFYNSTTQPEAFDGDDDIQQGNDMFVLFSTHHRVLEVARCRMDPSESNNHRLATTCADILTRFGDPQYVKVVMQNCLRLRFFTVNICFKIFYYVRQIFPDLELNQRFQVMHCLNVTTNIFDKIQILGYNLLLYDNSYVDYYTFKEFQQFSDEFEKITDEQFELTPEMRDAMAMEFLDSDFIEIVVKACDTTAKASSRKRMKYTESFCC